MIATRRPVSRAASRIRLIACACSEGLPCEKFNRATFIPARMSRASISGDSDAGPIVATILVLCAGSAAFMQISLLRSQTWLLTVHALKNSLAHYHEEKCRRESAHQNAGQSFDRSEQSPFFWQYQVSVTDRGVGHTGKIERRLGVRQTFLPPEKQRPDRDLKQMNHNEQPRDANQQPRDRPEPRVQPRCNAQRAAQRQPEASGMNDHGHRDEA